MTTLNATSSMALSSISGSGALALLTFVMFAMLCVTLFIVVKHFRRIVYGLCVIVPAGIVGWISWGVVSPVRTGNYKPIMITLGVAIGLMVTLIIGTIAEKFEVVKRIEEALGTKSKKRK